MTTTGTEQKLYTADEVAALLEQLRTSGALAPLVFDAKQTSIKLGGLLGERELKRLAGSGLIDCTRINGDGKKIGWTEAQIKKIADDGALLAANHGRKSR